MSRIAVLGGGAGGLSAVAELVAAGHQVRLWNRRAETLGEIARSRSVRYRGVLGDGAVEVEVATTDLADAVRGVDAVVVCLPSVVHAQLFADLAALRLRLPVVLNPGHTGGVLHARAVFSEHGAALPPVAEFSTLTYVARVDAEGIVNTTSRARTVRVGCLPGHDEATAWAVKLFPGVSPVADVLASSLSNVNLVLHPPAAVLAAAWIEATEGDFRFYVDAMTPGVGRVLELLDGERLAVATAYGHALPSLVDEMAAVGTVDDASGGAVQAIRGGAANAKIKAPDSFAHRYYQEDFAFAVQPLIALADVAGVDTPIAGALLTLGTAAAALDLSGGLTRTRLGLARMTLDDLCRLVRD